MRKLLIVTTNKYPGGDAGAIREEAIAKIFNELMIEVYIVGLGESTGFEWKKSNDIYYNSLRAFGESKIRRVQNLALYKKRIEGIITDGWGTGFDYIMLSNVTNGVTRFIKNYCKKRNIKLLHNSVEWYSPEEFKLGVLSPSYQSKKYLNRNLIDGQFGVIAISGYLDRYFKRRGIKTVRIPAVLDISKYSMSGNRTNEDVIFSYIGVPGRKDYIAECVAAFALLEEKELSHCELRLVGVDHEELVNTCGAGMSAIKKLGKHLKCIGRVNHMDAIRQFQKADYSVFLRDADLRYAKAGFPTKFVESMAVGTPVICNLSSDLHLYLRDEENGLVCKACDKYELVRCIRKALALSHDEKNRMNQNARRTAEEHFDYHNYTYAIKELLYNQ
ncbi:MAG: glycosyltransferase [Lachnospiraceae bacterium]|nr:glycosyltransferase [Lachnospiraceae bacterium]